MEMVIIQILSSVKDFCDGLVQIIRNGKYQEIYNIASIKI